MTSDADDNTRDFEDNVTTTTTESIIYLNGKFTVVTTVGEKVAVPPSQHIEFILEQKDRIQIKRVQQKSRPQQQN